MSQETIDPVLDNDKVCEAMGCLTKATMLIKVRVGERGSVTLLLCSKCVNKFGDTKYDDKVAREQKK